MTPPRFAKRSGVSEVVGALLLIVVVVTAVGSLAVFVGSAQKQAQNRQSYLTNLQDDNLQISYAQFFPSTTTPLMWNSIDLTIRNANTQTSGLSAIELNSYFASTWYQVDQQGHLVTTLGVNQPPLVIPAKGAVTVALNLNSFPSGFGFPFARDAALTVVLRSSIGNFFTTVYSPPTAIAKGSTSAETFGPVTKDTVAFDGSQSYGSGTSIQSYQWLIEVPTTAAGCSVNAFTEGDYDFYSAADQTVQYAPSLLPHASTDCITGPIQAILNVTDQNGFVGVSQPLVVSPDPNIDPAVSISAEQNASAPCGTPPTSCEVIVTVTTLYGNPSIGAVVNAIPIYGDVTTTQPTATTCAGPTNCPRGLVAGQAEFAVSASTAGSIDFETGTLLPSQVAIP